MTPDPAVARTFRVAKSLTAAERVEMRTAVRTHLQARGLDYAEVCAGAAHRSAAARQRRIAAERESYQEQELRSRGWL